jgi:membrane associated rhomboid family serine protease
MGKFNLNKGNVITNYLLLINIVVFLLQFIIPIDSFMALHPFGSDNFIFTQYLTAIFTHLNILHLFFNMYALYMFGGIIERKYGKKKYLLSYLTIGVLANIIWHLIANPMMPAVGASGALYGILAIFVILNPDHKLGIMFLPFSFKAKNLFGTFLLVEFLITIFGISTGIAHIVHISGAIIGGFYYYFFMKHRNNKNYMNYINKYK